MSTNKISNQKTEVPTGVELNDKDYATCLLTSLKDMEKNYVIAMSEASNESLYEKYEEAFLEISALQRKTYEVMFKKGWYCLEKAQQQKITEKLNTLSKEYADLDLSN